VFCPTSVSLAGNPVFGSSVSQRIVSGSTEGQPLLASWEADPLPLSYARAPAILNWHGAARFKRRPCASRPVLPGGRG
jgi:hypothetical protein